MDEGIGVLALMKKHGILLEQSVFNRENAFSRRLPRLLCDPFPATEVNGVLVASYLSLILLTTRGIYREKF